MIHAPSPPGFATHLVLLCPYVTYSGAVCLSFVLSMPNPSLAAFSRPLTLCTPFHPSIRPFNPSQPIHSNLLLPNLFLLFPFTGTCILSKKKKKKKKKPLRSQPKPIFNALRARVRIHNSAPTRVTLLVHRGVSPRTCRDAYYVHAAQRLQVYNRESSKTHRRQ